MSDLGRKPLTDQAQEKLTPDSQKSTLDKATESVTGTADNIAGAVQPGDSKSTSQKLADETTSQGKSAYDTAADTLSSAGKSISDTVNKGTQQGSSNAGAAQESTKGYLEQAQDLAASALNTASKTASDLANSIAGEKK
ncbi:hypothetical protein B0A52_06519 [Exophiala mesophila]|uniref:Uncharacterized protein n=1 Tax=Exophiala mesophila TaxID=212818 RepID=A0A438N197_EXOME|nr:hypothetical protein B0A52_06519 [Exophiala mesophila]